MATLASPAAASVPPAASRPATASGRPPAPAAAATAAAVAAPAPSRPDAHTAAPPTDALERLDGVGPRLAEAIRRVFRTDAAFLAAARAADLDALARVEGLSEARAVALVRQVLGLPDGGRVAATPAARKVLDEAMERLLALASTAQGKARLRLLHPFPDAAAATAHARRVMEHAAAAAALDREAVRRALRDLRPPAEPAPRLDPTRLVVGEDAVLDRLHAAGVHRWAAVRGFEALREAEAHDLVVVVGTDGPDGGDNAVVVTATAPPHDVVPEATLAWAQANRPVLAALAELARLRGRPSQAAEALDALAAAEGPASLSPAQLRRAVEEERQALEAALTTRLASLQLRGDEVLAMLDKRLPPPVQAALDEALREARARLRTRTGLDFQPYLPGLPVETDEEEVARVERGLGARRAHAAFERRRAAARRVVKARPAVEAEVREALAFDAEFALGCFALEHGLRPARFGDGFAFDASLHLALTEVPDAQPVGYRLGGNERIALLTGANSGGKSTLLEHLAQLALLARHGLPVAGDVQVPWVDEVHLVTARRGLDAGAFETFLRGFLPLVQGDARRLVLVDEVEAVTELEAAGRILAFFVRRLAGTGSLGVVVTHLAPQVLSAAPDAPLRVDGIEATGLDAEHRLVVDRRPRLGHFARSTPELIVQRLAATQKGPDAALYRDLLAALAAPAAVDGRKSPK